MIDFSQKTTAKEREAEERAVEAQAYLTQTGWMVERFAETGKEIPKDVRKKRAKARKDIEAYRSEKQT